METLTENRLNERYSVGGIISGSPEVLHTTTQWIWIMRNGAMAHLRSACGPPVDHGPPVGNTKLKKDQKTDLELKLNSAIHSQMQNACNESKAQQSFYAIHNNTFIWINDKVNNENWKMNSCPDRLSWKMIRKVTQGLL